MCYCTMFNRSCLEDHDPTAGFLQRLTRGRTAAARRQLAENIWNENTTQTMNDDSEYL